MYDTKFTTPQPKTKTPNLRGSEPFKSLQRPKSKVSAFKGLKPFKALQKGK